MPGTRNVYVKNERYVPRGDGPLEWNAGPKVVHLDRVEWTTIPDAATKVAALQRGEQDWWENPTHDLMPLLQRDRRIRIEVTNPTGAVNMMRPNHLQPPFNNPAFRRALLLAIDQTAMMQAIVGTDPAQYHVPHGVFCPGTPMASEVGLEPLMGPRDLAKAREAIRASGYGGEKVAMLVATDYAQFKAIGEVAADMFQKVGVNVDYVSTDWGSMLSRRNNRGPVDQGGWSVLNTGWEGADHMDPVQPLRHPRQRQRPRRLARLVGQPAAGGAAQRLVRRADPGRAAARSAATCRCNACRMCPPSRSASSSSRPPTARTCRA